MSRLPERIGKYSIIALIGRGGMGSVYKAHDPQLDRLVAIKVMTEEGEADAEAQARFLREAQSAARLNHPNITTVYELGEDRGRVFIVMELLEGMPLSKVIAQAPTVPLRQKLALMVEMCEGLAFAHQRGVVHRDIKPANVFVLESGSVKILDFGIARVSTSELTRSGFLMGTPNYMSPEQARGRRTDARSDVFSMGVVFYELLSGRKPFAGADYFETLDKVRTEEPAALHELMPALPARLSDAVHRALAKDPVARYQTLDDLREELIAATETLAGERAADLREAVNLKFADVLRLHRVLVASVGAAALGDEQLPIPDPAATGAGLQTLIRELDAQADKLEAIADTAERVEPAVARGIAAFERGDFGVAVKELEPVLAEIPRHQRAREYRDRARLELAQQRTQLVFAPERPAPAQIGAPPRAPAVGVPAAPRAPLAPPAPVAFRAPPPVDDTEIVSGRRGRRSLATVATLALLGGGVYLFVFAPGPRERIVPRETPATSPRPETASPAAGPSASTGPATGGSSPRATPMSSPAPESKSDVRPGVKSDVKPEAKPQEPKRPAKPEARVTEPKPLAPGSSPARRELTAEQRKSLDDAVTLAQLFEGRGDRQRALREYRRALEIDPTYPDAKQGLAALEEAMRAGR